MCKHILNAQVSIRTPCCKKWFDCPECHAESEKHEILKTNEMIFGCKKCKKVFRKDLNEYDDSDEYCPGCDNHYVIDAKEPVQEVYIQGDENMIRDGRDPRRAAAGGDLPPIVVPDYNTNSEEY